MLFDAIVVAGGRSSRLGGSPKAALVIDGETLLERAIAAASDARSVVVVGAVTGEADLDDRVTVTREDPPFGGPVAAIAAGLSSLEDPADQVLVLACDMPMAATAVAAVVDAADSGRGLQVGGFIAVDEERHPQPLLAVYDTGRLREVLDRLGPDVDGASMRAVLAELDLVAVDVPPGSTDDVDSWSDAARFGVEHAFPHGGREEADARRG